MHRLAVIALGGLVGSAARYAVALLMPVSDVPWATLSVNVLGALAIGALAASPWLRGTRPWVSPFLITGVLGGFTTFSAFALELGVLLESGKGVIAGGYLLATMVAGLLAVRLGAVMAPRLGRESS